MLGTERKAGANSHPNSMVHWTVPDVDLLAFGNSDDGAVTENWMHLIDFGPTEQ